MLGVCRTVLLSVCVCSDFSRCFSFYLWLFYIIIIPFRDSTCLYLKYRVYIYCFRLVIDEPGVPGEPSSDPWKQSVPLQPPRSPLKQPIMDTDGEYDYTFFPTHILQKRSSPTFRHNLVQHFGTKQLLFVCKHYVRISYSLIMILLFCFTVCSKYSYRLHKQCLLVYGVYHWTVLCWCFRISLTI